MLSDAQAHEEYLGGSCVRFEDDGRSLHLGDENSALKRGDWTPPSDCDGRSDDVVVVPPPTGPS